jgi:hypothetical protein
MTGGLIPLKKAGRIASLFLRGIPSQGIAKNPENAQKACLRSGAKITNFLL